MKKIARYFFYTFVTLFIAFIAAAFLFTTAPGFRILLAVASVIVPGKLGVKSVEGSLLSPLTLYDIDYENSHYHLHVQKVECAWSPLSWIFGQSSVATLSWEKLDGLINNSIAFVSESGNVRVQGMKNQYHFIATSDISGEKIPNIHILFYGNGTDKMVQINDGLIALLNGAIHVDANLQRSHNRRWNATVTTNHLDPGRYWPEWPGDINFTLHASGDVFMENITLQLQNFSVQLRQFMLAGDVDAQIKDDVIALKSNHFSVKNLPEYALDISPDLKINYAPPMLNVNGQLNISKAIIKPNDFSSTVNLPATITYVNEPTAPADTVLLAGKININLVNPAHFTYDGLDADIIGDLSLKIDPTLWITANGELTATGGSYQAYGQKLIIRTGKLIYKENPVDNPTIRITAVKTLKTIVSTDIQMAGTEKNLTQPVKLLSSVQDLTVGIRVTGTLETPILTLFSEPAGLSQTDILSYLVFGHAPNKASGAQSQLLLQAVSSMNVGGTSANQITDQLQQRLGLTTLTVESSPGINPETNELEETTSLVVGKKLSEKLEISYSAGLDKPINVLRLKYLLGHHWFLQTQTSAVENGADLFYTIERD